VLRKSIVLIFLFYKTLNVVFFFIFAMDKDPDAKLSRIRLNKGAEKVVWD